MLIIVGHICESAEANVSENKSLSKGTEDGEGDRSNGLALRRKVVPGVMSHTDSASKKANNT